MCIPYFLPNTSNEVSLAKFKCTADELKLSHLFRASRLPEPSSRHALKVTIDPIANQRKGLLIRLYQIIPLHQACGGSMTKAYG